MIKNIIVNGLRPGYAKVMFQKVLRRLQNSDSAKAREWARKNCKKTIQDFCIALDERLWNESEAEGRIRDKIGRGLLAEIPHDLGGGGAHSLLYFFTRKNRPRVVVETGVAAGWSSSAILSALSRNQSGHLFSSDFPYFRMENPEKWVGVLVNDSVKDRWTLDTRGDAVAIRHFLHLIGDELINFLHYDSDKSYKGRDLVFKILHDKFADDAVVVLDDIQDNFYFRDFVTKHKLRYEIFEYEGKFLGVLLDFGRQLKIARFGT